IFALFIGLSATLTFGQQPGWERVTPLPQENTINDICIIPGTDRMIAVGEGSTVMISEDAGESWDFYYHPANMNNGYFGKCIYFLNQNTGFIAGLGQTILITTNGGYDWEMVYTSGVYNWVSYESICFIDENKGFAVGVNSTILKTNDGGNSWYEVETGFEFSFNSIAFCDQLNGFIVGSSGEYILKTNDGGITWTLKDFDPGLVSGNLTDICFVNEITGFITCDDYAISTWDGFIFKTINGGETWSEVYTDIWNIPQDIDFIDENTGIVGCTRVMYESAVLITNDGGLTWVETILPWFSWYGAETVSCFASDGYLCAGNMGLMFKSEGGANNWVPLHQRDFYGVIFQFQVVDEENMFAFSVNGTGGVPSYNLKKSINGGETWNNIKSTTGISAFDFLNPDIGFLAEYDYFDLHILKTENGGTSWTEISATAFDIEPVACNFYNGITGLICGENDIIRTDNGGYSWEEAFISGGDNFTDIEYANESEVFICGKTGPNSYVFKSVDGGLSWDSLYCFGNINVKDLFFFDQNTVFITGTNSIYKSVDGGINWYETTINSSNYSTINSICFPTSDIGYAVGDGDYETAFKSTDGGETWNIIETGSSSGLNGVYFFDELYGFVVGNNGIVLKTTTGGVTGYAETGISLTNNYLQAFPNPFIDIIIIEYNIEKTCKGGKIYLYDQTGQQISHYPVSSFGNTITISGGKLKPGVYFYQLKTDSGVSETKKMIKL
ncbi:MAG: T9SS type A sorting domain-containing protein, partial [Bacteroidales bacterium]|nr:T9SS type A sorting domain-containing protein [Bacteroidales bacterium]